MLIQSNFEANGIFFFPSEGSEMRNFLSFQRRKKKNNKLKEPWETARIHAVVSQTVVSSAGLKHSPPVPPRRDVESATASGGSGSLIATGEEDASARLRRGNKGGNHPDL